MSRLTDCQIRSMICRLRSSIETYRHRGDHVRLVRARYRLDVYLKEQAQRAQKVKVNF